MRTPLNVYESRVKVATTADDLHYNRLSQVIDIPFNFVVGHLARDIIWALDIVCLVLTANQEK